MSVYKASSLKDLLSKKVLGTALKDLKDIHISRIDTAGLSGSKMYKIELKSDQNEKDLYLKVNNLKEDWLAKVSNDTGRELIIFKDGIHDRVEEFIKDIYIGYYEGNSSYAILMNDMSKYIGAKRKPNGYFEYLNSLAKFHSKFRECDILSYKSLLSVDQYYDFLSISKVGQVEEFKESNDYGWREIEKILGKELFEKYNNIKEIDQLSCYYPKTFLHGDYRPDNTVYIDDDNIRIIDWANSGCGPCTLDLFWYIMTSVDDKVDKVELISYYKNTLEGYIGYKFTNKTWDSLLKVGMLCACRMFLASLIPRIDFEDKYSIMNLEWWTENLKFSLNY